MEGGSYLVISATGGRVLSAATTWTLSQLPHYLSILSTTLKDPIFHMHKFIVNDESRLANNSMNC